MGLDCEVNQGWVAVSVLIAQCHTNTVTPTHSAATATPTATHTATPSTCLPTADGLVPGTGHFHVYVDVPKSEQQGEGEPIPFDDAHKHFGKGQTAADLELSPVSLEGTAAAGKAEAEYTPTSAGSSRVASRSGLIAAVHVGWRQGDDVCAAPQKRLSALLLLLLFWRCAGQAHADVAAGKRPARILRAHIQLQRYCQRQVNPKI